MRISDWSSDVCSSDLTGKEKYAEIVHANSHVRNGPFVALNCGALPADLIEAELFGAEPGAYTGANKAREGKFEAADGGTLFLDEVGTLPLAGQVKLLRVLETGRFERLGGNRERSVTSSEEHTSELQSLMRLSYAVFCLKKKKKN